MMRLSDREASILLGAALMHWGVPFHSAVKRELNSHQQEIVDQASDKLVAMRAGSQPGDVELSPAEIALLADVTTNCLEECGNDPVDLRLHLKADERREVEALIERLKSLLGVSHQTSLS